MRSAQLKERSLQSAVFAMTLASAKAYSNEVAKGHDDYMYYYMILAIIIAILAYESVRRLVAKVVAWFAAQAAHERLMQQRLDDAWKENDDLRRRLIESRQPPERSEPAVSGEDTGYPTILEPESPGASPTITRRTMSAQAQVTYRRELATPRFQPLREHEHGAWQITFGDDLSRS